MKNTEERITKKELILMYGVDRSTLESWIKNYDLPMIQISSHKKYVRKEDLLNWENTMIKSGKFSKELVN